MISPNWACQIALGIDTSVPSHNPLLWMLHRKKPSSRSLPVQSSSIATFQEHCSSRTEVIQRYFHCQVKHFMSSTLHFCADLLIVRLHQSTVRIIGPSGTHAIRPDTCYTSSGYHQTSYHCLTSRRKRHPSSSARNPLASNHLWGETGYVPPDTTAAHG